jgi:hypothetical protein
VKILKLDEAGYTSALVRLSLSYNRPLSDMPNIAARLAHKDGGLNDFLESLVVWLDIQAPRYWWFNAHHVGITNHGEDADDCVIPMKNLTKDSFAHDISQTVVNRLNFLRTQKRFADLKCELPEGFLQRRVVCTNYKALRHIINCRIYHKLSEWQIFCNGLDELVEHPEFLPRMI